MTNMTTENRMTAAIEHLTFAVENLTYIMAELNQTQHGFVPVVERKIELTEVEPVKTEVQESISFNDFRAQLMAAAKDAKVGKDRVKAAITKHGGTKAIDITDNKRQAVLDELV